MRTCFQGAFVGFVPGPIDVAGDGFRGRLTPGHECFAPICSDTSFCRLARSLLILSSLPTLDRRSLFDLTPNARATGDEWPPQRHGALFSAGACGLTTRLALMTQHTALAARLPRFFFRPLMRGALRVRSPAALPGDLALLVWVHRRKSALLR